MSRRLITALVAFVLLVPLGLPAAAIELPTGREAPSPAAQAIEVGHIPECLEAVPAAVGVGGGNVNLDVTILMDGVGRRRASEIVNKARASYAPLDITLRPSYRAVSFRGNSVSGLIAQAKSFFGGARPRGSDVVHVLTYKDVQEVGSDAVAGGADCIGGVAFARRAFSASEVGGEGMGLDGLLGGRNRPAKVFAHEIGHLLGGHHHYANCAEGLLSELGEVSPCTLMFNAANLSSFNFSTLNGLIVRGHAEQYAAP